MVGCVSPLGVTCVHGKGEPCATQARCPPSSNPALLCFARPQDIPSGWNTFVYVLEGEALFGPSDSGAATTGPAHTTLLLSNDHGETGLHVAAPTSACRFVVIGGKPIGEPIVQHGPFVMNSREEIMKAMMDYQSGTNGFEGAAAFESSISHGV